MSSTVPTAIRHEDDDAVMARLRAARPRSAEDADAFLAVHGDALLGGILASAAAPSESAAAARPAAVTPLRRTVRRRTTRALVVAAALAAVAVPAAVLVQNGPGVLFGPSATATATTPGAIAVTTDSRAAATAPAGTVLLQLASAALREPAAPGSATVAYTAETAASRVGDLTALLSSRTQTWRAPDGSGRYVTGSASTTDPLSEADDSWGPDESPDGGSWRADQVLGVQVADLSTDPSVLARQVRAWAAGQPLMIGGDRPGTVADNEMNLITALLREPSASPAQRAAAFTVLSERSGVGLLGQHTDPLGRTGTAVEYEYVNGATWRYTLTFDSATSTLLASESALVDRGGQKWLDDAPVGVWDWTAYTASTMVDAVGDTAPNGG